jgi:hypothetical protein
MKSVNFKFNLDDKVKNTKTGFTGVISMCAIDGDPESPETRYFIQGTEKGIWFPERLLEEAV